MKLLHTLFMAWLDIGGKFLYIMGLLFVVVIIGAAIYAQWISPETDVNYVVNNQLLGRLPDWLPYVVLAVGLPMVILFAVQLLFPATWVMVLLAGLIEGFRWSYRRLRILK